MYTLTLDNAMDKLTILEYNIKLTHTGDYFVLKLLNRETEEIHQIEGPNGLAVANRVEDYLKFKKHL
jgi:hypothetical protein